MATARNGAKSKECMICCTPIPVRAKKCIRCGEYQDWRRFVPLGQNSLALLTALASVVTLAIAEIARLSSTWLDNPHDIPVLATVGPTTPDRMSVPYSNGAKSRVFVDGGEILCTFKVGKSREPPLDPDERYRGDALPELGQSRLDEQRLRDEAVSHVAIVHYGRDEEAGNFGGGLIEPAGSLAVDYKRVRVETQAYDPSDGLIMVPAGTNWHIPYYGSCEFVVRNDQTWQTRRMSSPVSLMEAMYYSGLGDTTPPPR